jgi:thioredoxin
MSKTIRTGWLVTLLLALGCAGQTATEAPAPAGSQAAPEQVEWAAELDGDKDQGTVSELASPEPAVPDPAAPGEPITVTDADFEQLVLRSSMPVLLDIWAEWCGPCQALAPIIDDLAAEYQGRVVVAKLDYDTNSVVPTIYKVKGVPTMIFFKNGQPVNRLEGLRPKHEIARALDSLLGG